MFFSQLLKKERKGQKHFKKGWNDGMLHGNDRELCNIFIVFFWNHLGCLLAYQTEYDKGRTGKIKDPEESLLHIQQGQ